jgi:nitronate monooxygenase
MTSFQELLGIELPIIQAPMAGVQGSALAVAVSNAGGLGSLPCAMLRIDAMRDELVAIKARTSKPFNVNFFCHVPTKQDPEREKRWRATLAPYYDELGLDVANVPSGPGRAPFTDEAANVLREIKAPVVSFHYGLPSGDLLARVRASDPSFSRLRPPWRKRAGSKPMASTPSSPRASRPVDIGECS